MGKKNKLLKFAEINTFSNVYQHDESMKGHWVDAFDKSRPLVLELACGKGEYTLGLAEMYPDRNYLGLDVKGNRIWRGAKTGLEKGLANAAFLRCEITSIERYFEPGEVDELWITFPDPQLRDGKAKHRLVHPRFLEKYRVVAGSGAILNLKTDSDEFFAYAHEVIAQENLEILEDCADVYAWEERPPEMDIRTFYEAMWLKEGKKIKYLRFRL